MADAIDADGETGNFVLDNAEEDMFNGVTLNLLKTKCTHISAEDFQQQFQYALAQWRSEGRCGVWVYVPLQQVL